MDLSSLNTDSVVNKVLDRIKEAIIKEELRPGDKLPTEMEMVASFGVGRNSIREAIKMLTVSGILTVKRGNGTYINCNVSPSVFNPMIFGLLLEPRESNELYELRIMFESMVLSMAIDKSSDDDIERVKSVVEEAKTLHKAGGSDVDKFVELDLLFHVRILESTHNSLVLRIGRSIEELFPKYIRMSISQKNGIARSIENHEEILTVLRNRDRSSVFSIVEKSLQEWKEQWKE